MTERPEVYCPGCGEPAPEGTYPDGYQGPWWCNRCLQRRIQTGKPWAEMTTAERVAWFESHD